MLGICQYMLGDMDTAKATFAKALKINPDTEISAGDTLDTAVIPFFTKIKSTASKPARPTAKPPVPKEPEPAPPVVVAAPIKPAKEKPVPKEPVKPIPVAPKQTLVTVSSNVKGATVSAGGTTLGTTDRPLEIRPGFISLEVSLAGYETQRKNINIREAQTNFVRIDLKKMDTNKQKLQTEELPPIEPLRPLVPVTKSAANVKQQPSFALDKTGIAIPRPSKDKKTGQDKKVLQDKKVPIVGPPRPPPATKQPVAAPTIEPVVTAAAAAPAVPPTPTPMPAPTPAAVTDASHSKNAGAATPAPEAEMAVPSKAKEAPDTKTEEAVPELKKKKTTARKSSSSPSIAVTLLPFGAGQFQNEHYFTGSFFALAEIGSLYYFFSKGAAAAKIANDTNSEIDRRIAIEETLEGDAKTTSQAETDAFASSQEDKVSASDSQSQLGIVAFGSLWAIGIIEALINRPDTHAVEKKPAKVAKKKSQIRGKKKVTSAENDSNDQAPFVSAASAEADVIRTYPRIEYHLNILPAPRIFRENAQPTSMLALKLTF
jgi:hypothetical protein